MKKKELMILIYDSETSYINKEQLILPKGKRERYADSIYIRNIVIYIFFSKE